MKDYYSILRVSRSATLTDIKAAYKEFALKLHPDRTGNNEEKTRVFKQLTEAYTILSNADRRQKYDSQMGISRVNSFYTQQAAAAAAATSAARESPFHGDIRVPPPPPGFKIFDFDEWNAWHYGDNATNTDPIQRKNDFMKIHPQEKGAQFFIRQKTREALGGAADDTYRKGKQEKDMIVERLHKRRERRMAGKRYDSDAASGGGSCVIS